LCIDYMLLNRWLIVACEIINLGHNPIARWANSLTKCATLAVYGYYL